MTDIFDTTIVCKKCDVKMQPTIVNHQGFELRAVKCAKCKDIIVHPADANGLQHFNNLKGKTFSVKLRVVGNSHAISIPKEIIDFMEEQHKTMRKRMDDMVRLCFEDFDKLSVRFGDEYETQEEQENAFKERRKNYEEKY
jgi:hypothetical protein